MPRAQSSDRRPSIMCSRSCAHIYGTSSKSIKARGKVGGFRMTHLWIIASILNRNRGRWMTAAEIVDSFHDHSDVKSVPTTGSLSHNLSYLLDADAVEFDYDHHPHRWRISDDDVVCLRRIMRAEHYDRLVANYGDSA